MDNRSTSECVDPSLDGQTTLVFDPGRFDSERSELVLPVRVKNISPDTMYPPLRLTVLRINNVRQDSVADPLPLPRVVNGKDGAVGAESSVDYSPALRDLTFLPPGAVTEAVTWRVRVAGKVQRGFLSIQSVVTARCSSAR